MPKKKMKATISAMLAAMVTIFSITPFFAALSAELCSLTVDIAVDGEQIADTAVRIAPLYYDTDDGTATVSIAGVEHSFNPVGEFSLSGITAEELAEGSADTAKAAYKYIIENAIEYTEATTGTNGLAVFSGLASGMYLVFGDEDAAVQFDPYVVTLPQTVDGVTVYDVFSTPKISISGTETYTSVSVTKIWNDNGDTAGVRPSAIEAVLYLNGTEYLRTELSASNGWRATFENLPEDGEYTVAEVIDGTYYTQSLYGTAAAGFTAVNTIDIEAPTPTPDTDEYYLAVSKVWDDNDDEAGVRPTYVTVQLIKDGEVSATATLNETNGWYTVFTDLDADSEYTIKEITPTDYSATYTGSMAAGYVITNKYTKDTTDPGDIPEPRTPETPETASIEVTKVWEDDDNAAGVRPESVTVYLITGGSVYKTAELNEANGWSYVFYGLPVSLTYTIMEVPVDNYSTSYSGSASEDFTITNTYTEGTSDTDPPPDPSEPEPSAAPSPTATPKPASTPKPGGGSSGRLSTPTPAPSSATDTPSSGSTSEPSSGTTPSEPPGSTTNEPSGSTSTDTTPVPTTLDNTPSENTPEDTPSETITDEPSDEEPPEETEEEALSEPEEEAKDEPRKDTSEPVTIIPQTGNNYVPIYVLSAIGALCVIAGVIELIIGSDEK